MRSGQVVLVQRDSLQNLIEQYMAFEQSLGAQLQTNAQASRAFANAIGAGLDIADGDDEGVRRGGHGDEAKALASCEVEGEQTGKPWKEDAGLMELLRTL